MCDDVQMFFRLGVSECFASGRNAHGPKTVHDFLSRKSPFHQLTNTRPVCLPTESAGKNCHAFSIWHQLRTSVSEEDFHASRTSFSTPHHRKRMAHISGSFCRSNIPGWPIFKQARVETQPICSTRTPGKGFGDTSPGESSAKNRALL